MDNCVISFYACAAAVVSSRFSRSAVLFLLEKSSDTIARKKKEHKKAVHEINNDRTTGIQEICVNGQSVFQNVIGKRQQEKEQQSLLILIMQTDDIRHNIADDQIQQRNRHADRDEIGYNRTAVEKEGCQRAEPFSGSAHQVSGQHRDRRDIDIPVKGKTDQEDQRQMYEQRIAFIEQILPHHKVRQKLYCAQSKDRDDIRDLIVLKMDICQVERHHDTKEKDKAVIDKS